MFMRVLTGLRLKHTPAPLPLVLRGSRLDVGATNEQSDYDQETRSDGRSRNHLPFSLTNHRLASQWTPWRHNNCRRSEAPLRSIVSRSSTMTWLKPSVIRPFRRTVCLRYEPVSMIFACSWPGWVCACFFA